LHAEANVNAYRPMLATIQEYLEKQPRDVSALNMRLIGQTHTGAYVSALGTAHEILSLKTKDADIAGLQRSIDTRVQQLKRALPVA
jgi:hypothetical protein